MFVLKGLGRMIWGDPDKTEIVQISSGQLYLIRPKNSVKGTSECIFKDAAASIRRTTTAYNYQLVIQRAYEEGEEQLSESDDGGLDDLKTAANNYVSPDTKDERVFLLDEALHFRSSLVGEAVVLAWRDLSGDPGDVYKFICDSTTQPGVSQTFELVAYQCMWERKYHKPHDQASDTDLEQFNFANSPIPSSSPTASLPTSPSENLNPKGLPISLIKPPPAMKLPSKPDPDVLTQVPAKLHLFDPVEGVFMLQDDHVAASVIETGTWEYWLSVSSSKRTWISQKMEAEMNPVFNYEHLSFIWNYFDENSRAYSWLLRFDDRDILEKFQEGVMRALWERLNQLRWMKNKGEDRDYVIEAFQGDVEMPDQSDDEEEEEKEEIEDQQVSTLEDYDEDEEYDRPEGLPKSGEKNSALAVGYKSDRSFVVRGDRIGVFKHTKDDRLEYSTSINRVSTLGGKKFVPAKIMLHEQDASLLLHSADDPSSLYRMDLEVGKVVEDWKVREDLSLKAFGPESKFAQMTPERTLLGVSHNALFRIDPRLSGNKLVESQYQQYVSKNQFSAMATTEAGFVAVASEKGDIRLFDRVGIRAKVVLPALGEPITGLDVSADGQWILATCNTYLLLIDVRIHEGKYKGELGFQRSFGKDAKPRPRRLQLKPQHVAWLTLTGGQRMNFTPAKFNTGLNETETTIVTSVGPYVITWDVRKIQQNHPEPYRIRRYTDEIVSDNFRFGQDKNIVVALPEDVTIVAKRQLSRPTRDSFGASGVRTPGRGSSGLRSSIVNSPYSS